MIGGSGNGEQIAANKVPGCRAALAWNTETAQLAREHNNAQVVAIGARMHTADVATEIADDVPGHPVLRRRAAQAPDRQLAEYEDTGSRLPCRSTDAPMPEGHTLHRLARLHQRRYGGSPVAVSSPQGRFAAGASLVDGKVLVRAEAHGKHLFHVYGPDLTVHVHLGLIGMFDESRLPVISPVGQVRMRLVGAAYWTDLRGPNTCEVLADEEVTAIHARLGADPLRKDADPEPGVRRGSASPRCRSACC